MISISKDLYESLYILQSERSQLETIASSLDSVFEDQKRNLIYLIQELDNGIESLCSLSKGLENIGYLYLDADAKVVESAAGCNKKADISDGIEKGIKEESSLDQVNDVFDSSPQGIKTLFKNIIKCFGTLDFRFRLNDHLENLVRVGLVSEND